MSVHYHGLPIWGGAGSVCKVAISGAGAFISYVRPDQIKIAIDHAESIAIDNGAFSAWRRGINIKWSDFYAWLMRFYHHEKVKFFVIPDVVDGGEKDNDALIKSLPSMFKEKASPVWHLHESLERLVALCEEWPRVCFGSSGKYASIRSKAWRERMDQAFTEIYIKRQLQTKIHGLRMLDGRVVGNYPIDSADSTNLACNVPKFEIKHPELTRAIREAECNRNLSKDELKRVILEGRCAILKGAIEKVTPPTAKEWVGRKK